MSNIINKIQLSGVTYTLSGTSSGGTETVEVTQAEYDALVSAGTVAADTYYIITDATPIDVSTFVTSGQMTSAITQATSGKVDSSSVVSSVTSASTDSEIPTAKAVYDAIPTQYVKEIAQNSDNGVVRFYDVWKESGYAFPIYNFSINGKMVLSKQNGTYPDVYNFNLVETSAITSSVTSASTDSEIPTAKAVYDAIPTGGTGGGKAIEAGRGISVTTGETADTVSFSLPISAGTGTNSIRENGWNANTTASGNYSHAEGYGTTASGQGSHAEGYGSRAVGNGSHAEGQYTNSNNLCEHASGQYNVSSSASTTFGNSGNTLFSVGNGTADNARHNAFEIRQNGDIYLSSGGTDIKLQDYLGGGGSITIDPSLDSGSTNAVANSAITEAVNSKVNISDNNVSAFSDFKVALKLGYDYTSDNISTFYLKTSSKTGGSGALAYITTTDTNYPSITINGRWNNGSITTITTTTGITSTIITNGVVQITLTGGSLVTIDATSNGGGVFLYGQYSSGQTANVVEDTVYDALKELSNNKLDYLYSNEVINGSKTFLWGAINGKPIIFKQSKNDAKIGFVCQNSASTNNELATFEFRPDTYTDSSSVKHPLLYLGHYRSNAVATNGIVQTMVGFRQYDQKGAAAYHYLMPLPAEAKTPFSLTTSFKNYFAPLGFKNGDTMITTDNTGVADFSSVLGGLKLVKLTQSAYDALTTKDDNTVYFIGDSTNGYTMKIGSANVN